MGLLERSGPDVDVADLVVLAVEGEGVGLRPRLHDEVVRLVVLLAQAGGGRAVCVVGVHGGADGEASDEPPAADAVEHGELLRDAQGRVVEREAVAENDNRGVARAPRERGGGDVRRRHDAVGVVVMLVDADAVEAGLVGEFELVEVFVVELVRLDGVEEPAGDVDPDAAVLFFEVGRQVAVGHEVEPADFHFGRPPVGVHSRRLGQSASVGFGASFGF